MSTSNIILQIICGLDLTEGERLPSEREFAERAGISRTSVRNALKELQSRRVLLVRKGSGYYIASHFALRQAQQGTDNNWNLHKIEQIFAARKLIVSYLLEQFCLNKTDAQMLSLQDCLIRMGKAVIDTDATEIEGLHRSFFNIVLEACPNGEFLRMLNEVRIPSHLLIQALRAADKEYLSAIFSEHVNLLQAIKTGDPAAVRSSCEQMHRVLTTLFQLHGQALLTDVSALK